MSLSDLLTTFSLGLAGYILWRWLTGLRPAAPKTVKHSERPKLRKLRSAVQKRSTGVNPRSSHQEEESAPVERSVERSTAVQIAPPAGTDGHQLVIAGEEYISLQDFHRTAKALQLKAAGKTKQQAIEEAFNCRKGAGETWQRAVRLFDLAAGQSPAAPTK